MQRVRIDVVLSVLFVVCAPLTVAADDPRWVPATGWKKWLPWQTSTTSTPVAVAKQKSTPSLNGRPLWLPQNKVQSLSGGTKKVTQGMYDAVTLKGLREKMGKAPTPKYSQVRVEKKQGPFSSLFKPAPPQSPRTMSEWMSLERPKM